MDLIDNRFRVACIGSREISDKTREILKDIGRFIARKGGIVVSGNAIGSDYAYASGANEINPELVELYVVDKKHNPHHIVDGNVVIMQKNRQWQTLAREHHDAYDNLSSYVQSLMDRNAGIILNSYCTLGVLNPNKSNGGGTGHGWKISKTLYHPMIELTHVEQGKPNFEEICAGLIEIAKKFRENEKKS